MRAEIPVPQGDLELITTAAALLEVACTSVHPIAPDASTRRFYRLDLGGRASAVACVYPGGEEARAHRDWEVHQWAWQRRLPVPEPLGRTPRVILSADVGRCGFEAALRSEKERALLPSALACLQKFQECPPEDAPNPPFDAHLFRRELQGFAAFLPLGVGQHPAVAAFFHDLAESLAAHPRRLTHRDFHADNLLLWENRVVCVDFQDLRAGPDTYDLVSLLRERGGSELIQEEAHWCQEAAKLFRWEVGWQTRYRQCAGQRGLKVLGTFLRLATEGRPSYLRYVPAVARKVLEILGELGAPAPLVETVAALTLTRAYNATGEEP